MTPADDTCLISLGGFQSPGHNATRYSEGGYYKHVKYFLTGSLQRSLTKEVFCLKMFFHTDKAGLL